MRNDIIAKVERARAEALVKERAYENITAKKYDYWRALATVVTYDNALAMLMRGTEHRIPDMATEAIADFEYAHNDDPTATEMTLAFADWRRDALASVADWMNTEERWTK